MSGGHDGGPKMVAVEPDSSCTSLSKFEISDLCIQQKENESVALQKLGPCGGDGGEVGNMDPFGVAHISRIVIRHKEFIHAFIVHYQHLGREESTGEWGKPAGKHTEIALQPNEHIMTVRGHYGYWGETVVVRSLKLETNFNTFGPFGMEKGTSFEFLAPGRQIIGFHARHSQYLNAIGVYVKAIGTTAGDAKGRDAKGGNATNASFAPRLKGLQQEELILHLYMQQNFAEPSKTHARIGGPSPERTKKFGITYAYDWPLLDGHDASAKVVARARGIQAQCHLDDFEFYRSYNIVFEDKWKGSSLQVHGLWIYDEPENPLQELAIVGGTGQFTLAQGIIYTKELSFKDRVFIIELFIHAFYWPLERPNLEWSSP